MTHITRRRFLLASSAAIAAGRCTGTGAFGAEATDRNDICVFTKPFNSLSFDELADRMADLGVDGIEAPIRKGGHIEPEQVEAKLPELVEALKKRGLGITVLTSDVNDPDDPMTERVLRTAATLGIQRYRMKYLKYDLDQPIQRQINRWRSQLKDLAALNHDFGIRGVYQNHAGTTYMGAALWDLWLILRDIPATDIAVAYDIRHATVEGTKSWPVTYRMIRPHIDTVYVKDFDWSGGKVLNVPLGKGLVDPKFFQTLAESDFDGPISLHEEYLDHRKPELVPDHISAIRADLSVLSKWLKR